MALDFYRKDNKEHLFVLDDNQFEYLIEIFNEFKYQTGLLIDQYGDLKLTIENQKLIIKIIDNYIDKSDLNKNKAKTKTIIEFRTFLKNISKKEVELNLKGD